MSVNSPIYIDDDSPLSSPFSSDSDTAFKPIASKSRERKPFVSLPWLSSEKKLSYKPLNQSSFGADFEARVDEVIGEYREGNTLYYFARHDGGIARKYLASTFTRNYGNLVKEYKKKSSEGTLAPFDPSAHYVHPLARVKLKIRISSEQISQASRSANGDSTPDSEEEDYTGDEEEDDWEDEYRIIGTRSQPRRSTRAALPFSPRKARARKLVAIRDSDSNLSDEDLDDLPLPVRRSTRRRKTTEIQLDSGSDYVDADTDGPNRRIKSFGPKKKVPRPRSVVPAYGRVRDVDTVDEDPFDNDDEKEILRVHRRLCERCHQGPAHSLLAAWKKKSKGKGRKRKRGTDDEFEWSDDEERLRGLGGWVQCLKCPVAAHWGCLASTQKDEILRSFREVDRKGLMGHDDQHSPVLRKRLTLEVDEMTEFVCGSCSRGGFCMGCMETVMKPDSLTHPKTDGNALTNETSTTETSQLVNSDSAVARELFFRCFMCKRLAHYDHLPKPPGFDDSSIVNIAEHYQNVKKWLCADCSSFKYDLDKIIAWRPYPPNAVEPVRKPDEVPNHKHHLPREYLVKWNGRSYRRLDWVPHMWLASTKPSKLKNFIIGGTKVDLLEEPVQTDAARMDVDTAALPTFEVAMESRSSSIKPETALRFPVGPMPDAEQRIPPPWKTVHRVLDAVLWRPNFKKGGPRRITKRTIPSDSEDDPHSRIVSQRGEQPADGLTIRVDDWEKRKPLEIMDIGEVAWAFIKWDELGYEEACWDAPPQRDEIGYDAFRAAFEKFLESRKVLIPHNDKNWFKKFDNRVKDQYLKYMLKDAANLNLGQAQHLKLMPFQVDGFNWLCNNWWNRQHCILADEMGLGKTIQIVTFLGNITAGWGASPSLVVVPNSTIMNWVREFEKWAPKLRVVPFYGEKDARDVISEFELFHESAPSGHLRIKFHVLVTTYDAITHSKGTSAIFKHPPRWEVLVVDEGQRLKSDSSLLFRKLSEMNSAHRIIMTGTPLNNNIRELFNLMNFLDPEEWNNLEALEKQYQELDEELIKDLHNKLRPYFLRRIKSEVLELPPKNEVIVPVSMAPLQREVYRSILSNNLDILRGLTQPSAKQNAPAKTRINNVLMQLRKCLQHPYLYAQDIEPGNLSPSEAHEKLIDASAKLRLLRILLPKLKEGGHRVLLFSQFVIALNVIEDFLVGEKYKFLRLDGNTKGSVRQKAMDEFNKPGSEYFVFLLTTRAGGVGINLYTADTVIIFDPDFNPHQDLQAIARSYRYGQKKTCLVFKLMVKDSAEERIIQIGKKKLVLDHLIVQKMDDDEENGGEDVKSILTYGAQALFGSDEGSRDITYTELDVTKLIEKTQREAVQEKSGGGSLTFSFAKVWAANKDKLEEVVEEDQTDSWAQALRKLNEHKEKDLDRQLAESGRPARRKAADVAKTKMHNSNKSFQLYTNVQQKSRSPSVSEYSDVEGDSDQNLDDDFDGFTEDWRNQPLAPIQSTIQPTLSDCGLCGRKHHAGECIMVERSENLAEYREMLIFHGDDEPWQERCAAVQAIDEILLKRSHIHLIAGQPLHPLAKPVPGLSAPKKIKSAQPGASKERSQEQMTMPAAPIPSSPCVLCRSSTPHHYKDCPVIQAGSKSITKAIQELESRGDGALANTINTLRNFLAKAKSREITNGNFAETRTG